MHPLTDSQLDTLTKRPWELAADPHLLFTAYVISSLSETFEEDDSEEVIQGEIWGQIITTSILKGIVRDCVTDFIDCAENYKPVKVFNRLYPIKGAKYLNKDILRYVVRINPNESETMLSQGLIMDLSAYVNQDKRQLSARDEFVENRDYFRQIVALAENDEISGWDKLTDMELAVYCWGLFYNKRNSQNLRLFIRQFKNYLRVSEQEMLNCMTEKARDREGPVGLYTFSKALVQSWNDINGQKSYVETIPKQEAEDYWYNVALKTTFITKEG